MSTSRGSLAILRILLSVGETSAPYNQFSLAWAGEHDISLCSYFASNIRPPRTIPLFEGDGSLLGFVRALKGALDAKEYDIIHAHSPHVAFLFLVATAATRCKCVRSSVVTIHDSYQNYKLRNRLLWIPVFARFRRVVCCSRASRDSFPPLYRRLAGDRLCAVQNGLDIARVDRVISSGSSSSRQGTDFTLISVSRLVATKDPLAVLSAFHQSRDRARCSSRLVYIGAGLLQDSLMARRREFGLEDCTELTGLIPRDEVFERLLAADLFISAARGEGLPVAVLEAMACGCPVLLSDIPPHREIAEGVDFIPLIPLDDVAGFARGIARFREMSISDRTEIGQKCRALVEQRFSLYAMHAAYREVYAQIANGHTTPLGDNR